MKKIQALLLAGGSSTRVWPVENKLLVSFLGQPLILHSVNQLYRKGIRDIIVIINKNNENAFKQLEFPKGCTVKTIIQDKQPGMAGAITSAAPYWKGKKILIVGPSDIVEDYLLDEFAALYAKDPQAVLVGKHMEEYFPGGYLAERDGVITEIVEKPDPANLPSSLVNIVFDYWQDADSLLSAINEVRTGRDDRYEKAKEVLIKKGTVIKLLPYNGYWGYLKYPWHVLAISDFYLSGIKKRLGKVKIDKSAKIEGEVILEDGVTILENAKIAGPAFIGRNSLVGQNALIRQSHIGNNAVIGYSTEIVRSYIGHNCWFHHNFIGDSVVLDNNSLGSGAVIANYRLDGGMVKSEKLQAWGQLFTHARG